jgi:hypothetical protein
MRSLLVALPVVAACSTPSTDDTVFACDPEHPCPSGQVCSGESGVCLDHAPILYEDFERSLDAARWTFDQVTGTVTAPDAARAHWGDGGMQSAVTGPSGGTATIDHAFAAALPPAVYARVFVRHAAFTNGAQFLQLSTTDGAALVYLHTEDGALAVKAGRNPTFTSAVGAAPLTADTWTCVELVLANLPATGDGEGMDVRVGVDGVEATELHLVAPTRAFEQIRLGTLALSPAAAALDDLVVDAEPIGCE